MPCIWVIFERKLLAMAYILIDVIGIKELLKNNRPQAETICQEFWEICKEKALYLDSDNFFKRYFTFSDSLLMYLDNNNIPRGKELIEWANKECSELKKCFPYNFYMIINIGDELEPSINHMLTSVETDFNGNPNYTHIAGLGSDFADLFKAEEEIKKAIRSKKLNKNLNLYVNEYLLNGYEENTSQKLLVNGLYGKIVFYGFPWREI
jgi:hypothetical protein